MTRVTELADPSLAQRPRAKKPTEVEQLSLTVDGEERDGEIEMEMRDGVWLVSGSNVGGMNGAKPFPFQ